MESEFEVRGRVAGALDTAVDDVALGFEPSVTLTREPFSPMQ